MTRKPQRNLPKASIHLHLDMDVLEPVQSMLGIAGGSISSMSQLIEAALFLSEHMYIEEQDDGFIMHLIDLNAELMKRKVGRRSKSISKHLTLDAHVISFTDMLIRRYPMCFNGRNELIELLLFNITNACRTQRDLEYYARRLSEVLYMHP